MDFSTIRSKHFPALSHRDFRLFWSGQCVSLIGTWMQNIGQSWLVYQMTNSSFLLGFISTLQFTPVLLFSLPIGVIIDRYPKKKILFAVQCGMMTTAFTLSFLLFMGWAAYWNIAILATVLGILNSIDMPVRQSFMVELASKEHLMNAIALNSTVFNAARIIGPSIAGLVFDSYGAAACFLVNGLSFIPVLIGIHKIEAQGLCQKKRSSDVLSDIKEGLSYIIKSPEVKTTVLMVGFNNAIVMNFMIMIPVMARTVFNGDSKVYGYLMAALGIGAFSGALILAATSYKGLRSKLQMSAFLGVAAFVLIEGLVRNYYVAFIFFIFAGFCMTTALSSSNTTLQLHSPDELRGRIMSVYSLVVGGTAPIGSLYSGIMCEKFGVSTTFVINGLLG
ncbi:MAG: arabinose efflux permease family protein, partial [Clostridia bacterium]|nr:arabinose efflux permease family protein [Clostridia bacterium]